MFLLTVLHSVFCFLGNGSKNVNPIKRLRERIGYFKEDYVKIKASFAD